MMQLQEYTNLKAIEKQNQKTLSVFYHIHRLFYSAKFHPKSLELVCTSDYDKVIRVWSIESKRKVNSRNPNAKFGLLLQELNGHFGYINSICFSADGNFLYSADSAGRIFCWNCRISAEDGAPADDKWKNKTTNKKDNFLEWSIKEALEIEELRNQCINYIELHPNQRRLLVHLRDNQLKLVDIRIQSVVQRYKGAFNFNQNLRSTMSPCGTFVFSSGADTKLYCWNIDSGEQVTTASLTLNYIKPARDMCFHPFENMIAICSYDLHAPAYTFIYNSESKISN